MIQYCGGALSEMENVYFNDFPKNRKSLSCFYKLFPPDKPNRTIFAEFKFYDREIHIVNTYLAVITRNYTNVR